MYMDIAIWLRTLVTTDTDPIAIPAVLVTIIIRSCIMIL